jgi:acyl-CoA synthetase (AMP-forming)/AMP-acid ligase II
VIGVPDQRWGEVRLAIVAPLPGEQLTLEALQAYADEHLAGYKRPKHLQLVDALPRNATGKILKHRLRTRFGEGGAGTS